MHFNRMQFSTSCASREWPVLVAERRHCPVPAKVVITR